MEYVNPNAERRRFKRTEGVIYFSCRRYRVPVLTHSDTRELHKYKLLHVMLENLDSYIDYRNPKDADIYKQFVALLDELYRELRIRDEPKADPILYYKQPVIISGESFEFATTLPFSIGEKIELHLYFPIYPFSSVMIISEVIKIKPHSGIYGDKRIVLKYQDISIDKQEQVIKYVATREREVIRNKRFSFNQTPGAKLKDFGNF